MSILGNPTTVVDTRYGPVEIRHTQGSKPLILFMPGGHCSAGTPAGQEIYVELGHEVVSFSRPGYGATDVGLLSAAEFVPVVNEVCRQLGVGSSAAVVGASFGGLQALHFAAASSIPERLVLHSCAPSTLSYPDTTVQRLGAPLLFGVGENLTWALVRWLIHSDRFVRTLVARLSLLPVGLWFDEWSDSDRDQLRATFASMQSDKGFLNDVRQATPGLSRYRKQIQDSVVVPTLITASRHDRGVAFAHAEDLERTIPGSKLVETTAPSHLFWIGEQRQQVTEAVQEFFKSS